MIPVQNLYYMLSYAFQILREKEYKSIAVEQFDNVGELLSAILIRGVTLQLKRGLGKEYVLETDSLSSPRGKIDISESIKTQAMQRKQLVCSYDEFTVNSYLNRIIKSTMGLLLRLNISKQRKKEIKKLLVYFADVELLELHSINWQHQYNKNNQSYRLLISICYLVINGLLQATVSGGYKLMEFFDEQRMCRLYEKFLLEYFRKEHPEVHANVSQIPWQLDNDFSLMLPIMQTDIMLTKGSNTLIIDAKYYEHTTQVQYGAHTLHSGNLYQIFTYVKNKDVSYGSAPHTVSGMLLYAKTDEAVQPAQEYHMSGNKISVRTLDLNADFTQIRAQLDGIISEHFSK